VLIDKDVAMTTRDGVTLRADVYRPAAPGRYPVLLSRLPYDKNLRRRPGDIDVFVEHVFLTGHRIRVEISSSNFPRFDRNLNTGDDSATGTRLQTAQQTIFHDPRHPSHITLPIIPR
jgi:predicted acyl esterase